MDSVKHFMKLDWLAFKPHQYYLLFSLFPMISVFTIKSVAPLFSAATAAMMAFAIFARFFASEEKSGMARLYGLLPISKKDVVMGRYMNCIIMGLGCIFVSALLLGLCTAFIPEIKFSDVVLYYSIFFGVFLICSAIQLPIMFKLGYIKGQLPAMILPLLAFYAFIFVKPLIKLQSDLAVILALAGLLCLVISMRISIAICANKEV